MNETSTIAAAPTKLRSGSWGAKTQTDRVAEGDVVTITTRSGKSWQARIEKVVWRGKGVAICATESLDRPSSSGRRYALQSSSDYCGYRCPVGGFVCCPKNGPCHDCL